MKRKCRKLLSLLTALCLVFSMTPLAALADEGATLQSQINEAAENTETKISLAADTTESITIPKNKIIVLDLVGHTLTGGSSHTITNNGTLTVIDSGSAGGVSAPASGSFGAIHNAVGATANLYDGTWTQGTWYLIDNVGTMMIGEQVGAGINVIGKSTSSSVVHNGWYSYPSGSSDTAVMTINGLNFTNDAEGTVDSTSSLIKNDDGSQLTINGGDFTQAPAWVVLNYNECEITGGTFGSENGTADIVGNYYADPNVDQGKMTISGGTFNGNVYNIDNGRGYGTLTISGGTYNGSVANGTQSGGGAATPTPANLTISGGSFASDVSQYVAEGYICTGTGDSFTVSLGAENAVAQAGSNYYKSLADAVNAAQNGETVKVLKDAAVDETITITGKAVVLDLNGKTVNATKAIQIIEAGGLTIDGNGAIAMTQDARIGIWGNTSVTGDPVASRLTVKSGVITSSSMENIAVFGYGAIVNIEGGKIINTKKNGDTAGNFAIATNGTRNATENFGRVTLNITGGEIISEQDCAIYLPGQTDTTISGDAVVKGWAGIEIDSGNLTIKGGTIESTYMGEGKRMYKQTGDGNYNFGTALAVVSKGNQDATSGYYGHMNIDIQGGTLKSASYYAVDEYNLNDVRDHTTDGAYIDSLKISGGNFSGAEGAVLSDNKTKFIEGGYFTSDPSPYVAADWAAIASDKAGYAFMVGKKGETPAEVAPPAPPAVDTTVSDDKLKAEEKTLVENVTKALQGTTEGGSGTSTPPAIKGAGIEAAAKLEANNNTHKAEDSLEALKEATEKENINVDDVKIVVQPYMDIKITDVKVDDTNSAKTLTLDITPMYRTVATTANLENDDEIVLKNEDNTQVNAVEIQGASGELKVKEAVTVTIPLPTGFVTQGSTTLYVRHIKNGRTYVYTGTVDNNVLTFTNPHGFSEFTLTSEAPAAKIGEIGYTSLQDAVDAVQNGETITVLESDETATVSRTVSFKVEAAGNITYTITPGANTTAGESNGIDGQYTFTYNGGGGGGGEEPEEWVNPFKDVKEKDWFYDAVKYTNQKKLFGGTAADKFSPEDTMTRGMLVTVLHRLEGEPAVDTVADFSDVKATEYYAKPVNWAAANKIVGGFDGKFNPEDPVTREEMAAILHRYASYKAYDVSATATLDSFRDGGKTSSWAVGDMKWAVGAGMIYGRENNTLAPGGTATRAEVAQIMMRFCEKFITE